MARLKRLPPRISAAPSRISIQTQDEAQRSRLRMVSSPWRAWYNTARWKQKRMAIFTRDLFTCQMRECRRLEGDTSQLVCDHIKPHRGDDALFWDDANLQTLCKPCHDRLKQIEERRSAR
jgi:5-methylcytosine-specific restriction endonuclease McrA